MLKPLAKFSSLIVLSNLFAVKAQGSENTAWGKYDDNLQFRGFGNLNGFRISHFGDDYEANTDYTGLLFYDMGSCTKKVVTACRQMKDGYVIFHKNEDLIKLRNERGLKSLGEAALEKFFKKRNVQYLTRLVTDYGVKMAMFNLKNGVLNTQLSTKVMRIAVDNSPDMNAYEYALLDGIRNLWVKDGISSTHMVPEVQNMMRKTSQQVLKSVAGLALAEEFRQEYAPSSRMPKPTQVVQKQTAPTNEMHHGRKFKEIDYQNMSVDRQVNKKVSNSHQITMNIPRIIGAGGGQFNVGDPLNPITTTNLFAPKAGDKIRKTLLMGRINNRKAPGESDNNIFGDSDKLVINSELLVIQELPSTPENWAYFDCVLYKDGDQVNFNSPQDLYLTETELGDNYAQDHLSAKEHGGGAFIEYHDNEHWHYPMDETSGGYYIVGKTYRGRDGSGKFSHSRSNGDQYHIEVAAMKIPYGFGVLSHPWVWHCDAFLTGKWRMAYGDTENYTTLKLYDGIANPTRIHVNSLGEQSNKADDNDGYGYDEGNY